MMQKKEEAKKSVEPETVAKGNTPVGDTTAKPVRKVVEMSEEDKQQEEYMIKKAMAMSL